MGSKSLFAAHGRANKNIIQHPKTWQDWGLAWTKDMWTTQLYTTTIYNIAISTLQNHTKPSKVSPKWFWQPAEPRHTQAPMGHLHREPRSWRCSFGRYTFELVDPWPSTFQKTFLFQDCAFIKNHTPNTDVCLYVSVHLWYIYIYIML